MVLSAMSPTVKRAEYERKKFAAMETSTHRVIAHRPDEMQRDDSGKIPVTEGRVGAQYSVKVGECHRRRVKKSRSQVTAGGAVHVGETGRGDVAHGEDRRSRKNAIVPRQLSPGRAPAVAAPLTGRMRPAVTAAPRP